MNDFVDFALVGGGLQNGLLALAIRHSRPDASIVMIERGAVIGGNHTWCFHAGDVDDNQAPWIAPLVTTRWTGYDVAFPAHSRRLDSAYACVTSEQLAERVTAALDRPGSRLLLETSAVTVERERVVAKGRDGKTIEIAAKRVIDARGPDAGPQATCGFQKFVGEEILLEKPHGLERPMLMDATVPQLDGFRFVYVLPLAPDRLLVEDTYFSDHAYLDVAELRVRIGNYIAAKGWTIKEYVREETGVLPLPWSYEMPTPSWPLVAGYAGGWFHPVTGYSFPIAVRLAMLIAGHEADEFLTPALEGHARAHARQLKFALRLNHMLFHWFAPERRYHVLERFYRLPEPLVRRFYALTTTSMDRARILIGRPPRGLSLRGMLGGRAS